MTETKIIDSVGGHRSERPDIGLAEPEPDLAPPLATTSEAGASVSAPSGPPSGLPMNASSADPKGFRWRFRDVGKVSPVLTWNELRALAGAGVVTDQHLLILVESNMTLPVSAFPVLKAARGAVAVVPAPADGVLACRACGKQLPIEDFRPSTTHPGSVTASCNSCVERHRLDRDQAVAMLPMSMRQMSLMQSAVTSKPRRGLRSMLDADEQAALQPPDSDQVRGSNHAGPQVDEHAEDAQSLDGLGAMMMVPVGPTSLETVSDRPPLSAEPHPLFPHAPAPAKRRAGGGWLVPFVCAVLGGALAVGIMLLLR